MKINKTPTDSGSVNKSSPRKPAQKKAEVQLSTEDKLVKSSNDSEQAKIQKLTILHTNDMHGRTDSFLEKRKGSLTKTGGMSQLASAIKKEREKDPDNTLLLDAGDISTGTPVSDFFKAIPMVDAMNALKYDAMAVGNHEFDAGTKNLKNLINSANFPVLSANIIDETPDEPLNIKPYIIKDFDDLKVGILGLTTPDAGKMLNPQDQEYIRFESAVDTAKRMIPKMKEEGANLVVILSHLGAGEDRKLAEKVDGINVIVGGHTHTEMRKAERVNGALIAQTGSFSRNLGKLELDVEVKEGSAKIKRVKSKLIPIVAQRVKPDRQVSRILRKYNDKLAPIMNRVIGSAKTPLSQRPYQEHKGESPLGNFVSDMIKESTGADIAIVSPSSLRKNLAPGKITVGDIHELFPWDNKISIVRMKGSDIKKALNELLEGPVQGFAVSGLKVRIDLNRPKGDQVVDVLTPDGKPLSPKKAYNIATRDWFAEGNAGLKSFKRVLSRTDTTDIKELLINRIEEKQEVYGKTDGRIEEVDSAR